MGNDRFVRWRAYTISQLTFAIDLFLVFAVGVLAYGLALLRDDKFVLSGPPKLLFSLGLFLLCASALMGSIVVITRLIDFRITAKKILSDDRHDESDTYENMAAFFGRLTWRLFWFQVATLATGVIGFVVGVCSAYRDKLW